MERPDYDKNAPQESSDEAKKTIRRFQFGIRHLLAITFLAAVGTTGYLKYVEWDTHKKRSYACSLLAQDEWKRMHDHFSELPHKIQKMDELLEKGGLQYTDIGTTAGAVEMAKENHYLEQARKIWNAAMNDPVPDAAFIIRDSEMRNLLDQLHSEQTPPVTKQKVFDCWVRVMDRCLEKAHASREDIDVTQAMIDAERLKKDDKPLSD